MGAGTAFFAYRGWLRSQRRRQDQIDRLMHVRMAELERAAAAKTAYFTQLSHEIRNPLNGILGAALALEAENLSPPQREQARTVHDCAVLLSSLVDNVLDFARIEAGSMDLRRERYDPRAMLGAVVRIVSTQAQSAGVRLSVAVGSAVPELVTGDVARVQQVLVNFTLNAIKFAPGAPVELTLDSASGRLEFQVADRGRGIPEAEKPRLFTRFSRLEAARQAGVGGMGLGLAVSRALAERMGGSIGVSDREGGGAIFWLRLALEAADAPVQADRAASEPFREFEGARALIVEDLDYNATALEFIAKSLGFECDRTRDAGEALQCLGHRTYTAVFVDCDLPGRSGLDFVRSARAVASSSGTAFVGTSAHASPAVRRACLDGGMDAFVTKPITPERLRHALRSFAPSLRRAAAVPVPPRVVLQPTELIDYFGNGTEAGRRESRRRFAEALQHAIDRMLAAQRIDDRETVRRAAHQMISLARMVGSSELSSAAEHLEEVAMAVTPPELVRLTAALATQTQAVTAAIPFLQAPPLVA